MIKNTNTNTNTNSTTLTKDNKVAASPFNIQEATIADIHHAMKAHRLSCVTLMDSYLERIAACDQQGPTLRAILCVNPDAHATAALKDAEFAATGQLSGPLHGIPIAVKDNYNTIDMPTTAGSMALAGVIPLFESTLTQKLRAAGAIILAKTNMHELALSGVTISSLGGQTKNPYDLTRTPGGSSGGSGVAVAANFCTAALGTDTVNSIRSPASANALVGFRPTQGLVSRAGVIPVSQTQDSVGPLTRTVADAARMLDVIVGVDTNDPMTARAVGHIPPSYTDYLDPNGLQGARIGVLGSFMGKDLDHEEVNQVMRGAFTVLSQAGAVVVQFGDSFPDAATLIKDYDVQKWEFKLMLNSYLKTLPPKAPVKTLADFIAADNYHKPSLESFLLAANALQTPLQEPEYLSRLAKMEDLRKHLLALMAEHALDAIVYPLQKCLVVPIGELNQADRNGILAAVTGFPAVTVPAGYSQPSATAPLGVPIGMDILTRPFDDAILVKFAYAFEQASKVRKAPMACS